MRPFPGIVVETVPPPLADTLPRMDIAAFVGFAESGPVDVPVPVEDMARYRDLFGADPALAFDAHRGRMHRGFLGPAVEAFFEGGGRRCWVVRVADAPHACRFALPGLLAIGGALPDATLAVARSPGGWARTFQSGTTLTPRAIVALRRDDASDPDSGVPRLLPATARDPQKRIQVTLATAPGTVDRGDLLEFEFAPAQVRLFLVVGTVETVARGVRVTGTTWQWTQSPPSDLSGRSAALSPIGEAAGWLAVSAWRAARDSGTGWLEVRRLTFEVSVWREQRLQGRIGDLAFWHEHPRFFGNLPSDEDLFWRPLGVRPDGRDAEQLALRAQASGTGMTARSEGRFPIAGPARPRSEFGEAWPLYLPDAMALTRNASDAAHVVDDLPDTLQARDGLTFGPSVFFDARLQDTQGESLLRTAEALDNAAREWELRRQGPAAARLRGLHALVSTGEVTLVAVPDAAQPRWSAMPREVAGLLPAPRLEPVRFSPLTGRANAAWRDVPGATSYELQLAESPDFAFAQTVFAEAGTATEFPLPESCALQRFFRVRALRFSEPSPWSNTRILEPRPGVFLACAREPLPELRLAQQDASPPLPGAVLVWHADSASGALSTELTYRVQTSGDALFESAVHDVLASEPRTGLPPVTDGVRYVRVRAESGDAFGPWSNAVVLLPEALSQPTLEPPTRPVDPARLRDLLSVHRALLRFCHARGDLLALLSLPRAFSADDAIAYLAELSPNAKSDLRFDHFDLPTRAFTLGESAALSHGAVYHPWVARLVLRDGNREPEFLPPEGAVAGMLARTAVERGAWISAANRPLAGVLALDPPLGAGAVTDLTALQFGVIRRDPRGFVLADDQTLSRDSEFVRTPVRRLLMLLRRLALREGGTYVFEPESPQFAGRVRRHFQRLLADLHERGALRGRTAEEAYRVVTDASVNPPQALDTGRFVVELHVAPSRPLRFLRVRLLQGGPQGLTVGEG